MKLELVSKTDISDVNLIKDEKYKNFGMSISDVWKNSKGLFVKKVEPKSPAGRSFSIAQGDILISVNGETNAGKKVKDVLRTIRDSKSQVNLELLYKVQEIQLSQWTIYRKQQITTRMQKINGSFGFTLRKKNYRAQQCMCIQYPVISITKEGNQAQNCVSLRDGDRLLCVDGLDVSWLSLTEIAAILKSKDEAEFTFEYNIAIVDLPQFNEKFDLEIDIPIPDLGLSFCSYSDGTVFIDCIQVGSVAERCGVFGEGDVILSINGIDVKNLKPSVVNLLLQNTKTTKKISLILNIRKEIKLKNHTEIPSSMFETLSNMINNPSLAENTSIFSTEEMNTTESTSGIESTDWKHVNTPASSKTARSEPQKYFSRTLCHNEQMKALEKLQEILSSTYGIKYHLSHLTIKAFNARLDLRNQNCTFCNKERHSVKLCTPCLTRMSVRCAESLGFLRSIIAQFVNFSTRSRLDIKTEDEDIDENEIIKIYVRNTVVALTEIFPNVFESIPELRQAFSNLAEKICNADRSCSTCVFDIKSIMLIVRKLLLLISLGENGDEISTLVELLISRLLDTKFTCDSELEHDSSDKGWVEESGCNISVSDNLDHCDQDSLQNENADTFNIVDVAANSSQDSLDSIAGRLPLKTNLEYLKIVHIQSISSESRDTVFEKEISANDVPVVEKSDMCSEPVNPELSQASNISKDQEKKTFYKGKGLKFPQRVWRSLESFLKPKRNASDHGINLQTFEVPPNEENVTVSKEKESVNQGDLLQIKDEIVVKANISHSNDRFKKSLRRAFENGNHNEQKKVRIEIVQVKLKSDNGEGFGLGISRKYITETASYIPVICAIKPNSPAHRTGILKVGDCIVAINHQSTLGLTSRDFKELKKSAFAASSVTLNVQFDVIDEEPNFGTFNVVLKRNLKIGLIFREMKRGCPVVVSGIVKGSAAHRCGQLYAGDEIMYFRCIRCKEFDPISSRCVKGEKLHLTVHRENSQDTQMKPGNNTPCYLNPCFIYDDFVPLNGSNFIVKSTAVRAVANADVLVYDQEVTLFRDSMYWDFGFLLGEHLETGRAFITDVRPGSPAHKCGVIKKFDRIVKVNGVVVDGNPESSALALLSQANDKVDLLIRRLYHEDAEIAEEEEGSSYS